ncbi:MAG TPA: YceH family protein [Gemmatimonadaceae bacterium]|nr:YceH family protein [Gemmatimonadaceae bacterium]
MDTPLTDVEARILGSLIEKELTTPDNYPLSLNALMSACNQTSNREPVVQYDEGTVSHAIESMRKRSLVRAVQQSGSRVMKYRHMVAETLNLDARQTALVCVLLLRGPQTVGELKTRTARLASFESLEQVDAALDTLIARAAGSLVVRLPRRPGQKEVRVAHLMAGEVSVDAYEAATSKPERATDRIGAVEESVDELRKEIADLRSQLESFRKQFE